MRTPLTAQIRKLTVDTKLEKPQQAAENHAGADAIPLARKPKYRPFDLF
jgi:hypothetical protein